MGTIWQYVFRFIIFIVFATFHEYGHGWMAYRLGDSTAKLSGRLSLNPLVHIDFMWTIILPALLLMSTGYALGSAKPVPVNPLGFRDPKRGMVWVGLAGPAANIIWAAFIILLMKSGLFSSGSRLYFNGALYFLLFMCLQMNVVLLVFNMLPIPPLDGSRILEGLLPDEYADGYARIRPYGIIIIMALMFLGVLGRILYFVIHLIVRIFAL